ncbi:MAG: hypothetical protein JXB13_19320 [Phycisphaerae bacterium]|nr:hypothetical protein [Phycisphaerae bacterium]
MSTKTDGLPSPACQWAALVLRLAVVSLFLAAVVPKFSGGFQSVQGTVHYFQTQFATTWLPGPLVTAHGYVTPFAEALIVLWLLTGIRLQAGWVFACLFMVSLAFGQMVLREHAVAAANFNYVLLCCAGLYLSPHDRFRLDGGGR